MNALEIEILRYPRTESTHRVDAVVVDHHGKILFSFGDIAKKIFPRSAVKPLQALALFTSGAVEKFQVRDEELALACSSHTAQLVHTTQVARWLGRMGLSVADLECGAHPPSDQATFQQMVCAHEPITALHNNCSGKHTGMLSVALALNAPTKNYIARSHPVQQLVKRILLETSGCEILDAEAGTDGCSLPTFAMEMHGLARAMACLTTDFQSPSVLANSCPSIFKACVTHPVLIEGSHEYCTDLMKSLGGQALVKSGAEGVMAAAVPSLNAGVVLKVQDGQKRAAQVAMGFVLQEMGLSIEDVKFSNPPIYNHNKIKTGEMRARWIR